MWVEIVVEDEIDDPGRAAVAIPKQEGAAFAAGAVAALAQPHAEALPQEP
jgi:hypothetical protein